MSQQRHDHLGDQNAFMGLMSHFEGINTPVIDVFFAFLSSVTSRSDDVWSTCCFSTLQLTWFMSEESKAMPVLILVFFQMQMLQNLLLNLSQARILILTLQTLFALSILTYQIRKLTY